MYLNEGDKFWDGFARTIRSIHHSESPLLSGADVRADRKRRPGLTCRRCGISRPTPRKWARRYKEQGEAGLHSQSHVRHNLPERKVLPEHETLILELRRKRHLGPKGLHRELERLHGFTFSTSTIWKVLSRNKMPLLHPSKRPQKPKRYTRPVPGDRIQIDMCKIGRKLNQFTAIDDYTRLRGWGYTRRGRPRTSVHFLQERMLEEFPFPIQRVQSDRGREFVAYEFQHALRALREKHIKFRPNRPRSPYLNGKGERSQKTDRMEFCSAVDRRAELDVLAPQAAWQSGSSSTTSNAHTGR